MTPRRAEMICLGALGALGLYSLALLPVAPSLVGSHPILLEALRGSTVSMVTGGAFARVGEAPLALALLAPFPTLMAADPFLWWAGRIWGRDVVDKLTNGRGGRWTERGMRWTEHYGSWLVVANYFTPIPSALVYAGAGWTGMRFRRFIVLDLIGTALWVGVNVGLGYAIGQSAVDVAKAIGRYSLYLTIAIVVGIVVVGARRGAREKRGLLAFAHVSETPPMCPTCSQPATRALGPDEGWECRNEACPEFGQPLHDVEPVPAQEPSPGAGL